MSQSNQLHKSDESGKPGDLLGFFILNPILGLS